MSHEVESMFSVKETPWHKLGKVIHEAPSINDGIVMAGLDWKVEMQDMFLKDGSLVEQKAIVRTDKNKALGYAGKDYHPLQNDKAFEFFDPFVRSGQASLETAGSLQEGKIVWILAKLNRAPIDVGGGDLVNKYLLLSNGHSGMRSCRVGFNPIRVVCANTLRMSDMNSRSSSIRIFHGKEINSNLDKIQEIVNTADASFEATAEQYKALTKKRINQKDLEKFVKVVFFDNKNIESERTQLNYKKMVETITRLFESGKGSQMKSAKGTAWGLYNSATEYLSWEAAKSDDRRYNNLWFGHFQNTNERAFEFAKAV